MKNVTIYQKFGELLQKNHKLVALAVTGTLLVSSLNFMNNEFKVDNAHYETPKVNQSTVEVDQDKMYNANSLYFFAVHNGSDMTSNLYDLTAVSDVMDESRMSTTEAAFWRNSYQADDTFRRTSYNSIFDESKLVLAKCMNVTTAKDIIYLELINGNNKTIIELINDQNGISQNTFMIDENGQMTKTDDCIYFDMNYLGPLLGLDQSVSVRELNAIKTMLDDDQRRISDSQYEVTGSMPNL